MNEGLLSVKNASGRQVSLLNTAEEESKRKYHCTEPGCNKSFTTSGHLARHNRIHTGEKNFPCLFPGCQSRFSRQDNMMQHYRTHMSPKSRRSQKRQANTQTTEETRPKPRLHAHQRIRSDPVQIEPPLTIDQHLSNYHQSLQTIPNAARFNQFPLPLSTVAKTSQVSSPTLSSASSSTNNQPVAETATTHHLFYQHRPLTYTPQNATNHLPFTLLHPKQPQRSQLRRTWLQENSNAFNKQDDEQNDRSKEKQNGNDLLQLAHIVSTFG